MGLFGRKHGKSDSTTSVTRPESPHADPVQAPPAYHSNEQNFSPDNTIDPPDVTAGFSNLKITPEGPLAGQEECIAHMKIIECFYRLRQTVSSHDGLFHIKDDVVHSLSLTDEEASPLLAKLAEKRWAIYVARAVDRFRIWQMKVAPSYGKITIPELEVNGDQDVLLNEAFLTQKGITRPALSRDNIPPVDVLMVWHTYLLNPRAFLEDCLRRGMMQFWHIVYPLELVANSINSETFVLESDDVAKAAFQSLTTLSWNNIESDFVKVVLCTNCNAATGVQWSELCGYGTTQGTTSQRIDEMLSGGRGYCDRGFSAICRSCSVTLNHEYLKLGKLCRDIDAVRDKALYPMPGTLFGRRGIPGRVGKEVDRTHSITLRVINELFRSSMGIEILALRRSSTKTIADVKALVEQYLKNPTFLSHARADRRPRLSPIEQNTFRRVMSKYWDNSSPFALDLVSAVIRQCSFTEKMHNIDWLHSPALFNTIVRLRIKYNRFLHIMATQNGMAVPTLDVDLAWHTNQLDARRYCVSTIEYVKHFVDHDDKVSEVKLNDAFAQTARKYQRMYQEPYSECTCWYCEAVRESLVSSADRFFNKKLVKSIDQLHRVDQDPRKNVHISSHNVMRPDDDPMYARTAQMQAADLEAAYSRASSRAIARGRPLPRRHDYYYSEAYGHPVYTLAYVPFLGDLGCTNILYPTAPGCMAAGAAGFSSCGSAFGGSCSSMAGCSSLAGSCAVGSCGSTSSGGMVSGCGGGGSSSCGSSSGGSSSCGSSSSSGGGSSSGCGSSSSSS